MEHLATLEKRALDLMKNADFGDEAIRVNEAIVAASPRSERAWTRLGRCRMEQRQFDAAIEALRTALSLNSANTIAANLLNEVRKRRAMMPTATERATTGFTAREFALLETLPPAEACDALRTRIELLFDAVNGSAVAARAVEARQRGGAASGSKLFHANSFYPAPAGHIFAFHHGGRWEPQFNLGWYTLPSRPSCMRIGIGFNTSANGRDADRAAGQERVLAYFDQFQRAIARAWRTELVRWMETSGGMLELGSSLEQSLQPAQAVERLLALRHAASLDWIFVGRWLFLDRPVDAAVLRDRATLARAVDDTFRALFPLWLGAFEGAHSAYGSAGLQP